MTNLIKLVEEFNNSAKKIEQNIKNISDNDILLKLYGLYKQAKEGDCNTECPSLWDLKKKYKWEAWNNNKGMKKENAMKLYIKNVSQIIN